MKIHKDYDLAELYREVIGKSDINALSPKIEQDSSTENKFKLRTYIYDEVRCKFDTKQPVHLAYGPYDECEKILFEFNALFELFKDYNLICGVISSKYVNEKQSKAMRSSWIRRKYNLNGLNSKEEIENIIDVLKEQKEML